MGKLTYPEIEAMITEVKATLKSKREALEAYEKSKGLKRGGDHSADKEWKKLKGEIDSLRKERDGLEEDLKANKPKKETPFKLNKYEYPQVKGDDGKMRDMTSEEKKKFRTAARNANKPKKEVAPKKEEKSEKKSKEVKEEKTSSKKEEKSEKKAKKSNDD